MKEYSLNFTKLSKHTLIMVADSRATINKCIMGISELMVNECRLDMFVPSMDIPRVMIYAEKIEEQKLNHVGKELKKVRTEDRNSSKTKFEVQDKPRFKRRFSNKGPPNSPRVNKNNISTPNPKGG